MLFRSLEPYGLIASAIQFFKNVLTVYGSIYLVFRIVWDWVSLSCTGHWLSIPHFIRQLFELPLFSTVLLDSSKLVIIHTMAFRPTVIGSKLSAWICQPFCCQRTIALIPSERPSIPLRPCLTASLQKPPNNKKPGVERRAKSPVLVALRVARLVSIPCS